MPIVLNVFMVCKLKVCISLSCFNGYDDEAARLVLSSTVISIFFN